MMWIRFLSLLGGQSLIASFWSKHTKLTKILKKAEKQYNQQLINGDELIFTEEDLKSIKNDLKNLKEYEKKVKKW